MYDIHINVLKNFVRKMFPFQAILYAQRSDVVQQASECLDLIYHPLPFFLVPFHFRLIYR